MGNKLKKALKLYKDKDPDVRAKAVRYLGEEGHDQVGLVLSAVKYCLSDPDPQVRKEAARAAGNLGELTTLGPLSNLLADPESVVRAAAAAALGQVGASAPDQVDLEPLRAHLHDPEEAPIVRERVLQALVALQVPSLQADYEQLLAAGDPRLKELAIAGWDQLFGEDGVSKVLPLLEDEAPQVRVKATEVLAQYPTKAVLDALVARLEDPSPLVVERVIPALADTGNPRMRDPLLHLAETGTSSVKRKARGALEDLCVAEQRVEEKRLGQEMDGKIHAVEADIDKIQQEITALKKRMAEHVARVKEIEDEYRAKIRDAKQAIAAQYQPEK